MGIPSAFNCAEGFGKHLIGNVVETAELRRPELCLNTDDVAFVVLGLQGKGFAFVCITRPGKADVIFGIAIGKVELGEGSW